jgi:hypothetical protein
MSEERREGPLDFSAFLAAFHEKITLVHSVGPNREGQLEVDGVSRKIRVRWPHDGESLGLTNFRNLGMESFVDPKDQSAWAFLEIDANNSPSASLAFATAVVAQLSGGKSFGKQVLATISEWSKLLEQFQLLSRGRQVGLLGELLFLEHLAKNSGSSTALTAWLGPPHGEHDFGLTAREIEVKTTESERRVHKVSSETQLVASPNRDLYLLSIKISASGASDSGFSLNEVVARIRGIFSDSLMDIDAKLSDAGWDDRFSDLYRTRFQFRDSPELFLVNSSFPAITRNLLTDNLDRGELVSSVSYKIDLSGVAPSPPIRETVGFGAKNG